MLAGEDRAPTVGRSEVASRREKEASFSMQRRSMAEREKAGRGL